MNQLPKAIIITLAGFYLASCGKTPAQAQAPSQPPVSPIKTEDTVETDTYQGFRFKDITGRCYSQEFIKSFSYRSSQVTFEFRDRGSSNMVIQVTAAGLKPNFAYQVKFIGDPAESTTNERLGHMGRWWRVKPNPGNALDDDHNAHKDDPNYAYIGYLVMGFFVTDDKGAAHATLQAANSFHVLWRTNQRKPEGNDGLPLRIILPEAKDHYAYSGFVPTREVLLYGEWEPTRVTPGKLEMPSGQYRCNLVLTEESFHDKGRLAGQWAHALWFPQDFEILP